MNLDILAPLRPLRRPLPDISAPDTRPIAQRLWEDEEGGPLVEYVMLLLAMLPLVSWLINPYPTSPDNLPALQNALMSWARDCFEAMTQL